MGLKALVTGACGFIGSHLVNYLKKKGYYVIATDIKPLSQCFLKLKCDIFYRRDLRELKNCFHVTEGVDYVYHLAANMGGIGYITSVFADITHDNTLMNIYLLEAARYHEIKRFFFTSSACVYPQYRQENAAVQPLRESDAYPAIPDSYYGWEKLYMEKLMECYNLDYGVDIRITRLHNVYGPYGTYEGGREKAPAALCRKVALAKDGESIAVWGDGKQTRTFLYIDDCIRGIDLFMESNYSKPLNIGSDRLVTVDQLTNMIIEISGKELTIVHDTSKPQGVRGRSASLDLVQSMIGWSPQIPLEEGLRGTYEWILSILDSTRRKG